MSDTQDGWVNTEEDNSGTWYYYEDGEVTTGWKYINGNWYYFNKPGGSMTWSNEVDGYYLGADGKMVTDEKWVNTEEDNSGTWYYVGSDEKVVTGWNKIGDDFYYFNHPGGSMTWDNTIDGFYLDNDGKMVSGTGWLKDEYSGEWYYFSDGSMAHDTTIGGYHVDNSGKMITGTGWVPSDGSWYFLKDDGEVATDWLYDKGNWYYLYPEGSMAHDTTIDGYYLNDNGDWVPDNDSNEDDESDDGIKVYTQEEADKYINSYLWGHCIGEKIYFPDEISGLPQKIIYQSSGYMYDYELKENPNPAFNGMDVTVDDITLPDGRVISDKTYSYQLVYTNEPQEPKVDEDIVFVAPEGGWMEGAEISAGEKAEAEAEVNKAKESIEGVSKTVFTTTEDAANVLGKELNGTVSQLKNGYKVEIPNGNKPIVVRVMNEGSGGRANPYYRVSIDGKGSLTLDGTLSSDRGLTHIDMTDDYLSQIENTINKYLGK